MKIKQKAPHSSTKQTKITKGSISSERHEPIITPQQVYLPSELALYRQLVEQLGLEKGDLQKFRQNFATKYREHLKLLQGHQLNEQKFRISKQYEEIQTANKMKQMRDQISHKQIGASERKKNVLTKSRQRMEMQQQNWRQIIEKNKKQYLRNIKNSMKLIKRWENKLSSSVARKNQILDQISYQMQEHNIYVNSVHDQTRLQQNFEAEQRILKLEQSLNLNSSATKRKTQQSQLNPEFSRFKQSTAKKNSRNSKTLGSQSPFQEKPSKSKLRASQLPTSQDKMRISKVNSQDRLDLKLQIDQQFLEESLSKNIHKSKRIAQARHVKSYLYDQRNRQNRLKKEELKLKLNLNVEKLKEEQNLRNKKLDEKFYQNRKSSRFLEMNQNKLKSSIARPSANISLPVVQHKGSQQIHQRDDSIQYSSVPLKYQKRTAQKYSYSKYQPADSPANRSENNRLFITDNGQKTERDTQGKYNRKIIQKLRSLSLVANIKYKMDQQKSQKDEMRGLVYKDKSESKTKRPFTYKGGY